jgi:hypothetical protein
MGSLASVSRRPVVERPEPPPRIITRPAPPTTRAPSNVGRVGRPTPPRPPELRLNIWESSVANLDVLIAKAKVMCPRGLDVQQQLHDMFQVKNMMRRPTDFQLMDVSLLDGRVVGFAALVRESAFESRDDRSSAYDSNHEMYGETTWERVCVIRILCAQPPYLHWVLQKILQHQVSDRGRAGPACDYTQIAVRVEDIPTFLKEGFVLGWRPHHLVPNAAEAFAAGSPPLSPGQLVDLLWKLLVARTRSNKWENSRAALATDDALAQQVLEPGIVMSKRLRNYREYPERSDPNDRSNILL